MDIDTVAASTRELDITSKFGPSLARYDRPTAIPSAAEIAEKKARRARLAQEHAAAEYLSLDPDELDDEDDDDDGVPVAEDLDGHGRLVLAQQQPLRPRSPHRETRLVRDDEDIMENFDEFTEPDGRILLTRHAEAAAAARRRQEMAAQIAAAEGAGSDGEEEDAASDADGTAGSMSSERARNAAFEAAQTRHGIAAAGLATAGATAPRNADDDRPRTPPRIAPLPTLDAVVDGLRAQVVERRRARDQTVTDLEALRREKVRLDGEEERLQRALRETADKFARLRAEVGGGGGGTPAAASAALSSAGTPLPVIGGGEVEMGDAEGSLGLGGGRGGLGLGMAGRGLESLGSSAVGTPLTTGGYESSRGTDDG